MSHQEAGDDHLGRSLGIFLTELSEELYGHHRYQSSHTQLCSRTARSRPPTSFIGPDDSSGGKSEFTLTSQWLWLWDPLPAGIGFWETILALNWSRTCIKAGYDAAGLSRKITHSQGLRDVQARASIFRRSLWRHGLSGGQCCLGWAQSQPRQLETLTASTLKHQPASNGYCSLYLWVFSQK